MGFDYFYGFIGGDANQWSPNLFRNTTQIYPFEGKPPGTWNLITAMADDAIEWMNRINQTDPNQPFFCYYVPGGTHAPHHPTKEWVDKISAMHLFDNGWNKLRDTIIANQKRLGVIPQDAKLTPWPKDLLKEWDQLNADEKKMFIRQGMAVSWPGHIKDVGGLRTPFHHVIDVVPTILEACGIRPPEEVDGIKQKPIEGVSFAYAFDEKNAKTPSTHQTQYFEMFGDHAIYHEGWLGCTKVMRPPWVISGDLTANPFEYPWELNNLNEDFSQYHDVASQYPDKVKEMKKVFLEEAKKYEVLPLDNSVITRVISPRPSIVAGRDVFTWTLPPTVPIDIGKAHAHKGPEFRRELAMPASAGKGPHQLLGILALECPAPALRRFAIRPEVSQQLHCVNPGVVEPGQEQLKGRVLPLLRHHLQQLGTIIEGQQRRGAGLATHAENRIALVGTQCRL